MLRLPGRHVEQQAARVVAGRVVDERADRAGDVERGALVSIRTTVGAEVGHHPRRGRAGHRPGEVEHLDARRAASARTVADARRAVRRAADADASVHGSAVCSPRRGARPRRSGGTADGPHPRTRGGDRRRSGDSTSSSTCRSSPAPRTGRWRRRRSGVATGAMSSMRVAGQPRAARPWCVPRRTRRRSPSRGRTRRSARAPS